jgi:hypothetical protein
MEAAAAKVADAASSTDESTAMEAASASTVTATAVASCQHRTHCSK